jgi:uncharacterized membrane protein YphA (DoxX/SURF4 family)
MNITALSTNNKRKIIYNLLAYFIASVWLVNGLFCKVLNIVPRHGQIVANILGDQYAEVFTKAIGIAEIIMTLWIVSGIKSRLNALMQIIIIGAMNILEFLLVPDLLLWGKFNLLFAMLFIVLIYWNEFALHKKIIRQL